MATLSLSDAITVLASYDSSQKTAANSLMAKQTLLKSQTSTLNSLVASSASQSSIASQAALVNSTQSGVTSLISYLKTLKASKDNATKVLLASNGIGPTGPVNNPLVGTTGPTGPAGPTGAAWSLTTDSTPTLGSSNPVTSNGVYTALQAANSGQPTIAVGTTGTSANDTTVKVLLHFEGANGSTTITDSSSYSNTFTCSGAAKLTTAKQKFGSSCLDLTTAGVVTGPSITIPSNTTWSIDFWVYPTTSSSFGFVYLGNYYFLIGSTFFRVARSTDSMTILDATGSVTQFANTWHHVCYLVQNAKAYVFVDGNLYLPTGGATNYLEQISGTTGVLKISASNQYVDELRLTVGVNKFSPSPNLSLSTSAYTSTTLTFPSPAAQGQLWCNGTNVYICTASGTPGSWRQFTIV